MAPQRANKGRRGQIVVMAPIVIVVLTCMLAITVDVGRMVLERALLQNGCDAGALAGAQVLLREHLDGTGESEARSVALTEAISVFKSNSQDAGVAIEFGSAAEDGSFVAAGEDTPATRVRATALRDAGAPGGALPLVFAGFFTFGSADVTAAATAEVSDNIVGVSAGLGPFAVPKHRIPGLGEEMIFYPADPDAYDEGNGWDTVAPGCWGLLNLDGGNLGTPELIDWIVNGYDGTIRKDPEQDSVWIDGTSGFRATIEDAMIQKIGKPMILLVYDQIVGVGATTDFRCVGFLRITVNSVQLKGTNNPHISATVEQVSSLHDVITGGGVPSVNIRKVQLVE
ncbi:MAG: hypothetical protein KAX19_08915 [Candidatus Brocadiae bacterium]|nr:hypothetical protein [Candidatus Brocadiia bacterium]